MVIEIILFRVSRKHLYTFLLSKIRLGSIQAMVVLRNMHLTVCVRNVNERQATDGWLSVGFLTVCYLWAYKSLTFN